MKDIVYLKGENIMEKKFSKIGLTYATFKYAALSQLAHEDTFIMGIGVGIYQGLKYNGSLSRGLKAGGVTMLVISAASGVMNVLQLRGAIEEATESK